MKTLKVLSAALLLTAAGILSGCGNFTGTSDIINAVAPASNKALDQVLAETWNSKLPCSWPARAWVARAAETPGEGETFSTHCDPYNFLKMKDIKPAETEPLKQ